MKNILKILEFLVSFAALSKFKTLTKLWLAILTTISSNITMVKNSNGLVYWPIYGINNLGNMNPGEGYQIKMLAADTLLYPAN